MKYIKITKTALYADPIPSLPHLKAEEGEVIQIRDQFAAVMVDEYKAAEYVDAPAEEEESDTSDETADDNAADDTDEAEESNQGDEDADVTALMEAHTKKVLQAACVEADIDDSGSKTELATRLVGNGITEIVTE